MNRTVQRREDFRERLLLRIGEIVLHVRRIQRGESAESNEQLHELPASSDEEIQIHDSRG